MKRIAMIAALAFAALGATACTDVESGNVGVKVYLLGEKKGVDHEVLGPGRYYIGVNEKLYTFPTVEQNPKYTKGADDDAGREIDFQTSEGMMVDADFGITYVIERANVATVFQKYRKGVDEINSTILRNLLRDTVVSVGSKMPFEQVYGPGKDVFMAEIEKQMKEVASKSGLTVTNVSLLSSVRPPQAVVEALNAKMEATQRAQQRENELREAEAEAAKRVAQAEGEAKVVQAAAEGEAKSILLRAEAQAKANRILNESLTVNLIEYEKTKRWNGALPQVTGGNTPFISLNR